MFHLAWFGLVLLLLEALKNQPKRRKKHTVFKRRIRLCQLNDPGTAKKDQKWEYPTNPINLIKKKKTNPINYYFPFYIIFMDYFNYLIFIPLN